MVSNGQYTMIVLLIFVFVLMNCNTGKISKLLYDMWIYIYICGDSRIKKLLDLGTGYEFN